MLKMIVIVLCGIGFGLRALWLVGKAIAQNPFTSLEGVGLMLGIAFLCIGAVIDWLLKPRAVSDTRERPKKRYEPVPPTLSADKQLGSPTAEGTVIAVCLGGCSRLAVCSHELTHGTGPVTQWRQLTEEEGHVVRTRAPITARLVTES